MQLRPPVDEHGVGHDDKMGPEVVLLLHEMRNQRHHLHGAPSVPPSVATGIVAVRAASIAAVKAGTLGSGFAAI